MKYHYGEAVHSFNGKLENLKSQINAKTGIPAKIQKLYYKNCLVNEESISTVPNGSTLMLLLPSRGGTGNCDICYEDGKFTCSDCQDKIYCAVCCKNVHKHPSWSSHKPVGLVTTPVSSNDDNGPRDLVPCTTSIVDSSMEGDDCNLDNSDPWDKDFTDSPNTSQAFVEASMIMTLAEKFNITRFRPYRKETITALLSGQDCLVIQPTGSGKSMYFQFPVCIRARYLL